MLGMARAVETADVVTGDGTLDVTRYGQILRARSLVGVRGAGIAFDGMHYVDSTTHNLKARRIQTEFCVETQRADHQHAGGAGSAVLNAIEEAS